MHKGWTWLTYLKLCKTVKFKRYSLKYELSVTMNNVPVFLLVCKPSLLTNSHIATLWLSCYGWLVPRDPYYFALQFILVTISWGNPHPYSCLCNKSKEHHHTNEHPHSCCWGFLSSGKWWRVVWVFFFL
jgi:hypothetical protein